MDELTVKIRLINDNPHGQLAYFTLMIDKKLRVNNFRLYRTESGGFCITAPNVGQYFYISDENLKNKILNLAIRAYYEAVKEKTA